MTTKPTSADIEWERFINKHEHAGRGRGDYCPTPWSAVCQSERLVFVTDVREEIYSQICWSNDFATHAEALCALEKHLLLNGCDPRRDVDILCPSSPVGGVAQ